MIASNSEIVQTLRLLQRRPQKVIDVIYQKLLLAEKNQQTLLSSVTEQDMLELRQAYDSLNMFEKMITKYI